MNPTENQKLFPAVCGAMLLVLVNLPNPVIAASGNWTNNASGNWSGPVNWDSNPTVPGTAAGDIIGLTANISTGRSVTNDIGGGVTLGLLNIGDADNTASYTLTDLQTNTITFNNSGSTALLTQFVTSKGDTINAAFALADNLAITNASTNNLTLNNFITGSKSVSITSTNGGYVYFNPNQIRAASSSGTTTALTMGNTAGLAVGMGVTGAGISSGAYIVSVDSSTQVTLSANATNFSGNATFVGSTFSGGCTLTTNTVVRIGQNAFAAAGVTKSGALGAGNITFAGNNTLASGAGNTLDANQITYNGDITLGLPTLAARIILAPLTNDLGGATRTINLIKSTTANSLASGVEGVQFTVPTGGPNGRFQNGNLVLATTNTGANYAYFRVNTSSDFINNGGLTLNDHVIFTSGTSTPFTSANPPAVTVNSGAIFHTDDGTSSSRTINLYSLSGSGFVTNGSSAPGTSVVTIYGGTATFSGAIADNPSLGKISITKNGSASTQTFSGATTYSGLTTVTAGTLVTTTLSTNSAYTVSSGATLGVKVAAAGSSLGINGFTNAASSLQIDLNGFGLPTAPVIINSGNNTVNGNVTVNLVKGAGTLTTGTFTVITNASATRSAFNYVLGSVSPGLTATLADNTNLVTITITAVTPVSDFVWTGAADTNWNFSSRNWQNDSSTSLAYNESPARGVIFDDSASGSTSINIASTVSPTNVSFASSSKTYSLSGPGKISGSTGLKVSSGTVNISTANDYTGQTTVSASGATLVISNATALGSSAGIVVLASNATLRLGGNIVVTNKALQLGASSGVGAFGSATSSSNVWTGNVTITQNGARLNTSSTKDLGVLKISGQIDSGGNNFLEAINVRYGTVYFGGANTYLGSTIFASGTGILDGGNNRLPIGTVLQLGFGVGNAGTFDLNGWNQELAGLQLYGVNNGSPSSTVQNSSATLSTLTLNAGTNATSYGGILTGNLALTKAGTNVFALTGNNFYSGVTTVNAGTLLVDGNNGSSSVTVNANATLGGLGAIGGNVTFNSGSHAVFTNGATLTISGSLNITGSDVHLALPVAGLAVGNYTLANYNTSGSSGAFNATPVVDSGTLGGNVGNIVTSAGTVVLQVTAPASNATLTNSFSGGVLTLNWPAGWTLQAQTNNLSTGLGGNWVDVPSNSPAVITPDAANGSVFYRLKF